MFDPYDLFYDGQLNFFSYLLVMSLTLDNLKRFIATVRNISFFDRLFGWKKVKNQLVDAVNDLAIGGSRLEEQSRQLQQVNSRCQLAEQDNQQLQQRKRDLELELVQLRADLRHQQLQCNDLEQDN